MNTEDEEFNRIEREASMRVAAVKATVAKKEWVGLTDEEIEDCYGGEINDFAKAIEAKLKELNT